MLRGIVESDKVKSIIDDGFEAVDIKLNIGSGVAFSVYAEENAKEIEFKVGGVVYDINKKELKKALDDIVKSLS